MSKVMAYYHIVFCTKQRQNTIPLALLTDVYHFIWSIIKENNSTLIRIGGISNHLHLLIDLHQSVALSELIKKIKSNSSNWMRNDPRFSQFIGWAKDYFATTVAFEAKANLIKYINSQQEHHLQKAVEDEFRDLYRDAGLEYDERDMY